MSRGRTVFIVGALGLVAALGVQWVLRVEHLLLIANIVAVLSLLALMGMYHRWTDWWASKVGLTTMALKGAWFVLAIGGLLRRIGEQLTTAGSVRGPELLDTTADRVIYVGWILAAAATTWRAVVMWPYLPRHVLQLRRDDTGHTDR